MEDKRPSDEINNAFWKGVAAAFTAFLAIIAASKSI